MMFLIIPIFVIVHKLVLDVEFAALTEPADANLGLKESIVQNVGFVYVVI